MDILIEAIGADRLPEYAQVAMTCDVRTALIVDSIGNATNGTEIRVEPVESPYLKDYDALPDGGPLQWPARFDISNWGLWIARDSRRAAEDRVIGGAAVAWATPGIDLLGDGADLAVLWDIRVRRTSERHGIGTELFREATRFAQSKGCRALKIETQNVNVAACRFYAKIGCVLERIDRFAYAKQPGLAREIMLVWHLEL